MICKLLIVSLLVTLSVYSYMVSYIVENNNIDNQYIWPCSYIFDMYEYPMCADVVEYYYNQEPQYYEKTITYFNLIPSLDYKKFNECLLNNDLILVVTYLNYTLMDSFWFITNS